MAYRSHGNLRSKHNPLIEVGVGIAFQSPLTTTSALISLGLAYLLPLGLFLRFQPRRLTRGSCMSFFEPLAKLALLV